MRPSYPSAPCSNRLFYWELTYFACSLQVDKMVSTHMEQYYPPPFSGERSSSPAVLPPCSAASLSVAQIPVAAARVMDSVLREAAHCCPRCPSARRVEEGRHWTGRAEARKRRSHQKWMRGSGQTRWSTGSPRVCWAFSTLKPHKNPMSTVNNG